MKRNRIQRGLLIAVLAVWPMAAGAADSSPSAKPTLANVAYGQHPKQVLDFWKADSDKPTPLVFFIHGGGWQGGTKDRVG